MVSGVFVICRSDPDMYTSLMFGKWARRSHSSDHESPEKILFEYNKS